MRDHVFDPNVIDNQLGTAVILKALLDLDPSVLIAAPHAADIDPARQPDDEVAESTRWIQQALNRLGATPRLVEDGRNGRRTMAAVARFQAEHGLDDTGIADARTIAAIQEAVRPPPAPAGAEVLARIDALERHMAETASATSQPVPGQPVILRSSPVAPSADPVARVDELLQALRRQIDGARIAAGPPAPGTVPNPVPDVPLGQVNGALGQTIGRLLDGKKSAIGIIGAVATQILAQVPPTTGLGQVIAQLTPAFGLSPYTMPIFLGLSAWGVLGKLEKWADATAKPAS
ncbi:peptidoglycan-binding protein [Methylobacterium persicinum]